MPLTENDYTGIGGDSAFDDAANWSSGLPSSTDVATIDANVDGSGPASLIFGDAINVGAINVVDGVGGDWDWVTGGPVNCLGDLALTDINSLVIGYVGGNVTGDNSLNGITIDTLDGSFNQTEVMVGGIFVFVTIHGGTGTLTLDNTSTTPECDVAGFDGTIINAGNTAIDLGGSALGANAILSPNRAAFTNFTGGAPDASLGGGSMRGLNQLRLSRI